MMPNQPENSPSKANFFLNAFNKYGRYMYLPGEPVAGQLVTDLYTITVLERLGADGQVEEAVGVRAEASSQPSAFIMRRIEPSGPVDFLEYQRRRN